MRAKLSNTEKAELRFRQLCCLSMSGPLLAPVLFRDLYPILPYGSCLYMWLGPTGPVDVYFNVPELGQYLPLYTEHFFRSIESTIWATTDEAVKKEFGPKRLEDVLRVPRAMYLRHPVYNEIMKPSNVFSFLRMLIRDHGLPIGTFTISRGPHDREFSADEQRTLTRLEPFIIHALAQRRQADLTDVVEGCAAMLTIDARGRIVSQSALAPTLLSLSQGSLLAPPKLHSALFRLVQTLWDISSNERTTSAPSWTARNSWGVFNARAYWLDNTKSTNTLIGMYLERRVPRHLATLGSIRKLSLPLQQERVALLLALGKTEEQAGKELGLTRNTVIYHRRQLYNRLEVDSRELLIERLSGQPSAMSSDLPGFASHPA